MISPRKLHAYSNDGRFGKKAEVMLSADKSCSLLFHTGGEFIVHLSEDLFPIDCRDDAESLFFEDYSHEISKNGFIIHNQNPVRPAVSLLFQTPYLRE
jgi:hypothetical protein